MTLNFAFAIPTFNRLEYLKRALGSIEEQQVDDETGISVIVSNIGSRDGTFEFLSELGEKKENIDYIIVNRMPEAGDNTDFESNFASLGAAIPDAVDWVWFLGDDDYIAHRDALKIICNLIKNQEASPLHFVSACQARRSKNSGNVKISSLIRLCNELGYHELLGWMSSDIMTRDIAVKVLLDCSIRDKSGTDSPASGVKTSSAYPHCAAMLRHAHEKRAAFVDLPLVDPQDKVQTSDSVQRWQEENIPERYLYVVDDLKNLTADLVLPKFSKIFFRYQNYNLWDRYILYVLHLLVDSSVTAEEKKSDLFKSRINGHWQRLASIVEMLADPAEKKNLALSILSAQFLAQLYIANNFESDELKTWINRFGRLISSSEYTSKILQD